MSGEARLQQELSKVHAAFVAAACEHREGRAALQQRVKALEADLATANQICRDQEYHMQQTAGATGGSADAAAAAEGAALRAENAGLRKRVRELDGLQEADEALRKRVKELEVIERGWAHLRGVFAAR